MLLLKKALPIVSAVLAVILVSGSDLKQQAKPLLVPEAKSRTEQVSTPEVVPEDISSAAETLYAAKQWGFEVVKFDYLAESEKLVGVCYYTKSANDCLFDRRSKQWKHWVQKFNSEFKRQFEREPKSLSSLKLRQSIS